MKKLIIAAIALIAFTANTFAADTNDKTMNLFKTAYPGATNIHYKALGDLVSIHFTLDSTNMEAFYNEDGEQVAVSRAISLNNLPLKAITTIGEKYSAYSITGVIELDHSTEGISYYVSMVSSNQNVIARVTVEGEVSTFKKSAR